MKNNTDVPGRVAVSILLALLIGCFASSAVAGDKASQITGNVLWRDDRVGGSLSYLYAVSGDISAPGVVFRLGAGIGGDEDGGSAKSVDAMAGYQFVEGSWKIRTFAGVTFVDTDTGSAVGAKLLVQAQTRKKGEAYVSVTASADSAKMQVQGSVQLGAPVFDLWVGPEAGVVAAEDFVRSRLGLVVTGIKLGEVGVSVRGGYSFYQGTGNGKDTPYVSASATLQY